MAKVETLTTRTLTDILDHAACPRSFDFLSIDVEGYDEKALGGLDLDKYRPRVILIEMNNANIGSLTDMPVSKHLTDYSPIAAHWTNIFFRLS